MGLFVRDDPEYNEGARMVGFNRYKQLLSFHAGKWLKVNLITTLGALPLAGGFVFSILSSSSLLMLGTSFAGGLIFGPFFATMLASIMRGLMDAPGMFWDNYRKAWKQNLKTSLLPGGFMGMLLGMFVFMIYMLWEGAMTATPGTLALFAFAALLFVFVNTLLWPQLVLFDQSLPVRLRNILLFGSKYLWKVCGVSLLQLAWITLFVLFSPFTLLVIPFLGFWYILFLSQLILYEDLNYELRIEELYGIER